ncbi:hypothetical protein [Variovorax soli]|uniref:SlyX protein n=1 Tax=Variovorax soli TaxID=376815 RepID=A0ABU1NAX1_9BURK|nr:hypothetical protein [Variovorax soli]MDR6535600.1 hypothetical protein [Variovorax soli]
MSLVDQLTRTEKSVLDALDGVLAEHISTSGRLDDLDFQIGELRDLLTRVLALLEPEDDAASP